MAGGSPGGIAGQQMAVTAHVVPFIGILKTKNTTTANEKNIFYAHAHHVRLGEFGSANQDAVPSRCYKKPPQGTPAWVYQSGVY